MKTKREYVAGWDGGGTKTTLELRDRQGNVLGRAQAGALNPNGGVEGQTDRTVAALLAEMERMTGDLGGCRMLCIGAAGVSNPDTARLLRAALERGGYRQGLTITGDHHTALYGALGKGEGAILIAGTGSICYGRSADGREHRCGGWGNVMDDEGSGYAIGRDILAAVVRAEDGRAVPTCLSALVRNALDVQELSGIIRYVYAPDTGKRQIAALARLLDEALEQGDAAACAIADKAARELAELVVPVIETLALEEQELALMGSILTRCEPVSRRLRARLAERFARLRCIGPRMDAAAGAALLALELANKQE